MTTVIQFHAGNSAATVCELKARSDGSKRTVTSAFEILVFFHPRASIRVLGFVGTGGVLKKQWEEGMTHVNRIVSGVRRMTMH